MDVDKIPIIISVVLMGILVYLIFQEINSPTGSKKEKTPVPEEIDVQLNLESVPDIRESEEINNEAYAASNDSTLRADLDSPNLDHLLEKALNNLLVQEATSGDTPDVGATLLKKSIHESISIIVPQCITLLHTALQKDDVQSILLREGNKTIYMMAIPLPGDRPHLLKQVEGFSMGLSHHIDQVFSLLQSGGKQMGLLLVAFFRQPGAKECIIYAGYRDDTEYLLPISLLNNSEISRFKSNPSNFRQVI